MLEFLKYNHFFLFYVLAMVYSLVKYRYYFDSVLKYFPIIIGYTLLSEILGLLIRDNENFQLIYAEGYSYYNQMIFNIFDIVFFLYFLYVFWNSISKNSIKKIIKYGSLVFITVSVVNTFLQDIMLTPQILTVIVGSILIVACSIVYLFQVIKINGHSYRSDLLFWISVGLVVFYTFYPILLSIGVWNEAYYENYKIYSLLQILISAMYLCFIIGFIVTKRKFVV